MRPNDLVDDRETQTAAAVIAGAGFIEPDESLQHPLPFGFGDAGPVVVDRQPHLVTEIGQSHIDAVRRMPAGVFDEVSDHPPQRIGVPFTRAAPTAEVSTRLAVVDRSRCLLERQVIEVDGARAARRARPREPAAAGPRRDSASRCPGQHHVGELFGGGPLGMRQGNLGVLTDGGERRAHSWDASDTNRR